MCGLCAKYFQPHIAKPVLSVRASPLLEVHNLKKQENEKLCSRYSLDV